MAIAFSTTHSNSPKTNVECKLKIDKLTLLLTPPEMLREGIVPYMIGLLCNDSMQSQYGFTRAYIDGSWGYEIAIQGKAPKGGEVLSWTEKHAYLLQISPKKNKDGKRPFMRLDINPEGLTSAGLAHLRSMLDGPFDLPWPWWSFAHVSRIDAALDLHGIKITDWAWDMPGRRNRDLVIRDGEIETIYLGSKKGSFVAIYNKAAQAHLAALNGVLTRIEYRWKNPGPVNAIASLVNPYSKLEIFDPAKMMQYSEAHRNAMRPLGQLYGRRAVVKSFPPSSRLAVEKELNKTEPCWWDSDEVWKIWPQVTAEILPSATDASGKPYPSALAYSQVENCPPEVLQAIKENKPSAPFSLPQHLGGPA